MEYTDINLVYNPLIEFSPLEEPEVPVEFQLTCTSQSQFDQRSPLVPLRLAVYGSLGQSATELQVPMGGRPAP